MGRRTFTKVKNGRIVRVNIHTYLDEAFRRAMSGNEMSADEEEQIKTCVLCRCLCSCAVDRKGQGRNILSDQT